MNDILNERKKGLMRVNENKCCTAIETGCEYLMMTKFGLTVCTNESHNQLADDVVCQFLLDVSNGNDYGIL